MQGHSLIPIVTVHACIVQFLGSAKGKRRAEVLESASCDCIGGFFCSLYHNFVQKQFSLICESNDGFADHILLCQSYWKKQKVLHGLISKLFAIFWKAIMNQSRNRILTRKPFHLMKKQCVDFPNEIIDNNNYYYEQQMGQCSWMCMPM